MAEQPGTRSGADVLAVVMTAWAGWCALSGTFVYNLFTDRDLLRAALLPERFEAVGSEMTGDFGARLPGVGLGAMLWAGQALTDSPVGAYVLQTALWLAGGLGLYALAAPALGQRAALVALALMLTHPANQETWVALWNPGFVAGFAAVATGALLHVARDARAAPLWAGALAWGAQVHMTAGAWLLATLPGALLGGVKGGRRTLLRALAVVLLLFTPYFADELLHGATNTLRLWGQVGRPGRPSDQQGLGLRFLLFGLGAPAGDLGRLLAADAGRVAYAVAVALLVPIGVATALSRRGAPERTLAIGLSLEVAAYALGGAAQVESRYLVVLTPAIALLAAIGLERVVQAAPGRAAVALIAALLAERGYAMRTTWSLEASPFTWRALSTSLEGLQRETGWTLAEASGRTAWRRQERDGERMGWRAWPAVGFLLHQRGEAFPGSQPPPCALVAGGAGVPDVITADVVARLVDARGPVTVLSEPVQLGADWRLVRYAPATGRCPTSMVQRYIDTEAEAAARPLWQAIPDQTPVELPLAGGRRVALMLADHPHSDALVYAMLVVVDLLPSAGRLNARFEGNQLRGYADNVGYTEPWALERPRLVLTGASGEVVELPLADDRVGRAWDLPPLQADAAVQPGVWTVELVGDVIDVDPRDVSVTRDRVPFRITLLSDLVVP